MGSNNPFEIIALIAAVALIVMTSLSVVLPSFVQGIDVPDAPKFPQLPDLNVQGNLNTSSPYLFDENHTMQLNPNGMRIDDSVVTFSKFSPDKRVTLA
jgi:hypothetical protein